jgi:glutathionyl-hydroquinone reductase
MSHPHINPSRIVPLGPQLRSAAAEPAGEQR